MGRRRGARQEEQGRNMKGEQKRLKDFVRSAVLESGVGLNEISPGAL